MDDLYDVIDKLPTGVAKVSLYVGNNRGSLDQVFAFDSFPDGQAIEEQLQDEGFGTRFSYARLIFRDEKGKQVKSLSLSKPVSESIPNDMTPSFNKMVDGYLRMQRNYERVFDMFMEGAKESANREKKLRDDLFDLQDELLDARTKLASFDVAIQTEDSTSTKWGRTMETLEHLGAIWITSQESQGTTSFLEEAKKNPSLIESLFRDPNIASFVQKKLSRPSEDVVVDTPKDTPKEGTDA